MRVKLSFLCAVLLFCLIQFSFSVWAEDRFTDNGDGTVTDHKLGLKWAKADNQGDISRKDARAWIKHTYATREGRGQEGWRLPTLQELESLYLRDSKYKGYKTEAGPFVKIVPAIKLSHIMVWSSDDSMGSGIVFDFNAGISFTIPPYRPEGCRVLPVSSLK